ncbi:hypothetical protein QBC47DRAFT_395342 [Echria macrotheca]|uniref:Secreted protein n=1 Tax=Echria macrotheca TaxID=438768 RepID=A0AAJ0B5K9_9PEZI|nr:hypothetical protein QBC47DRAFT_395342 [Echria macrotheca]
MIFRWSLDLLFDLFPGLNTFCWGVHCAVLGTQRFSGSSWRSLMGVCWAQIRRLKLPGLSRYHCHGGCISNLTGSDSWFGRKEQTAA